MRGVAALLAVLLLLPLPHPLQAQEQAPIVVTATSVHYSFGQQATFSIAVSADAGIHALYLYLQKEGDTRIDVAAVPFEGGTSVQASAQLDLRHHSLPPFGDVAWWWEGAGCHWQYADHRDICVPVRGQSL